MFELKYFRASVLFHRVSYSQESRVYRNLYYNKTQMNSLSIKKLLVLSI